VFSSRIILLLTRFYKRFIGGKQQILKLPGNIYANFDGKRSMANGLIRAIRSKSSSLCKRRTFDSMAICAIQQSTGLLKVILFLLNSKMIRIPFFRHLAWPDSKSYSPATPGFEHVCLLQFLSVLTGFKKNRLDPI